MATDRSSGRGQVRNECHLQKGMSILLDIFYRADFNADGVLKESEFKSGCCDRHMSEDDIGRLFKELSAQDNVIHVTDFCSFIIQHAGPFREVLSSLEDLSTAMCKAVDETSDNYEKDNFRCNFVSRLLLRELLMQLAVIQSNTETLLLRIDDAEEPPKSRRESAATTSSVSKSSIVENDNHQFIDVNREDFDEFNCTPLRVVPEDTTHLLEKQVNKLEILIDHLNQIPSILKLNRFDERLHTLETMSDKFDRLEMIIDKMGEKIEFNCEDSDITQDHLLMVVQQKLEVEESHYSSFKKSLDKYVQETRNADGCQYISILSYQDSSNIILYEIWEDEDKWNRHLRSPRFKTFQHQNIEHLKKQETVNTIQLPGNAFVSCWRKSPR